MQKSIFYLFGFIRLVILEGNSSLKLGHEFLFFFFWKGGGGVDLGRLIPSVGVFNLIDPAFRVSIFHR